MFNFSKEEMVEEAFRKAKELLSDVEERIIDEYLSKVDLTYEYEGLLKDEAYADSMRQEAVETPLERIAQPLAEQIAAQYPYEWTNH